MGELAETTSLLRMRRSNPTESSNLSLSATQMVFPKTPLITDFQAVKITYQAKTMILLVKTVILTLCDYKKLIKLFIIEDDIETSYLENDKLEEKWGKKYPIIFESWRNKWENLSHYFKYPEPIRRIIYTTNIIESVHRQFRTLTKTKGAFPNDNSLLKLLYAGIQNAEKKWTMPIHNWSLTISQLNIHFKDRLKDALGL